MKAYSIRNGEIFEPEVKEERTNKHRKEKEQECNCNRPYEIELTNEEWFCGLPTEKKAELLHKNFDCFYCPIERKNCRGLIENCEKTIMDWLKEKHNDQA